MSHLNEPRRSENSEKLQVWMCHGCQAVHFKTGNVLLNFTHGEFAELTRAVLDIYSHEFGGLEFYRLINSVEEIEDEVLSSRVVS